MPTYLYECKNCGRFEKFQRITEDALKECPTCQLQVKRIIGAPGIIFKGSGFYSTDSRSSSNTLAGEDKKEVASGKEEKNSAKEEKSNKTEDKAS